MRTTMSTKGKEAVPGNDTAGTGPTQTRFPYLKPTFILLLLSSMLGCFAFVSGSSVSEEVWKTMGGSAAYLSTAISTANVTVKRLVDEMITTLGRVINTHVHAQNMEKLKYAVAMSIGGAALSFLIEFFDATIPGEMPPTPLSPRRFRDCE
ncbi:PREDICTED: uncharacterized protein LOC106805494 isoform X2 [Priapulus caudatus]|uniref:Uncharacterized protein LOC106805494 isoform X2 n=1 Tax=Priapulus caudatus TaxID=37621 RepID=A0ABM1DRM4_PRICU|nr:PREDICTED: uncharacterized protein LOC106805494 isoform X2 [Priapulus caudatus]